MASEHTERYLASAAELFVGEQRAYSLGPETNLLAEIVPALAHPSVVDVGAARGDFGRAMVVAGAVEIHLVEAEPRNLELLHERFRNEPRARVHASAGEPMEAVVETLAGDGEIAPPVGILKLGAGRSDLAAVACRERLDPDVIVTELWLELDEPLGACPWTLDELTEILSGRGFRHFAAIVHRGEGAILEWDEAALLPGGYASLVFLHDRVLADALPAVLRSASTLARNTAELAERRLEAIDGLARARDLKAETIDALTRERDIQAQAAAERLRMIEQLAAKEAGTGRPRL